MLEKLLLNKEIKAHITLQPGLTDVHAGVGPRGSWVPAAPRPPPKDLPSCLHLHSGLWSSALREYAFAALIFHSSAFSISGPMEEGIIYVSQPKLSSSPNIHLPASSHSPHTLLFQASGLRAPEHGLSEMKGGCRWQPPVKLWFVRREGRAGRRCR